MGSMDPHFARLLSSLTQSASTSIRETDDHKAKQISTMEPVSPSTRSRYSMRHHSARKPSLDVKPMSPLTETPRSPGISPNIKSSDATQSPTISTARSPRAASRRTSSTADISPYLTRPVELPTCAKQLKQVALLESVADESAKLVSTLTQHNSILPTSVDASHPGPVLPHQPLSSNPPHRVLYNVPSPSLQRGTPLAGLPEPLNMPLHGPMPVRSMTSHAHYRDATQAWPRSMNITPIRSTPEPFTIRSHGAKVHTSFLPQSQFGLPLSSFTKPTPTPSGAPAATFNRSTNSLLSILNSKPTQGLPPAYAGPFTHARY